MQAPGVKIVLSTGAAIVLALGFGDIALLKALTDSADIVLQKVPTAAWFFAPLLFTLAAWVLERLGLFQRVFSTLYKDLTDSQIGQSKHLSDKDKLRLTQMLERWKAPMPHLARADSVLAFWGGKERWSLDGFDRCLTWALIYPFAVLLLVWVIWNNGQLGVATIIPAMDDAWRRWLLLPILGVEAWLIWVGVGLSNQPDRLRQWWVVRRSSLL